jgi:predicted lipoprotein
MSNRLKIALIGLVFLGLFACSEDKNEDENTVEFNQSALLLNLSNNIIVPSYNQLNANVNDLSIKVDSFIASPRIRTLNEVRLAFELSYNNWQRVSFLELGPAATNGLRTAVNIYPANNNLIEQNISSNSYNLDAFSNLAAKGFPAIDYLLYAKSDSSVISDFNSNNRKMYLKNVCEKLVEQISQVNSAWNSSYKTTFESQTGTDIGSSIGMLINTLNQHYERNFRDGKIGIPLGIRSSGVVRLNDIEAKNSSISFDLIKSNFEAMKNIYFGENGLGLDDYLIASNASDVNSIISSQITKIESELSQYSGSMENAIQNQNQELLTTYQEIQKLIVYWKVDMPSRLGVLITYQDNDGD